eukprot:5648324-Amphidinium_carterae.1
MIDSHTSSSWGCCNCRRYLPHSTSSPCESGHIDAQDRCPDVLAIPEATGGSDSERVNASTIIHHVPRSMVILVFDAPRLKDRGLPPQMCLLGFQEAFAAITSGVDLVLEAGDLVQALPGIQALASEPSDLHEKAKVAIGQLTKTIYGNLGSLERCAPAEQIFRVYDPSLVVLIEQLKLVFNLQAYDVVVL